MDRRDSSLFVSLRFVFAATPVVWLDVPFIKQEDGWRRGQPSMVMQYSGASIKRRKGRCRRCACDHSARFIPS